MAAQHLALLRYSAPCEAKSSDPQEYRQSPGLLRLSPGQSCNDSPKPVLSVCSWSALCSLYLSDGAISGPDPHPAKSRLPPGFLFGEARLLPRRSPSRPRQHPTENAGWSQCQFRENVDYMFSWAIASGIHPASSYERRKVLDHGRRYFRSVFGLRFRVGPVRADESIVQ